MNTLKCKEIYMTVNCNLFVDIDEETSSSLFYVPECSFNKYIEKFAILNDNRITLEIMDTVELDMDDNPSNSMSWSSNPKDDRKKLLIQEGNFEFRDTFTGEILDDYRTDNAVKELKTLILPLMASPFLLKENSKEELSSKLKDINRIIETYETKLKKYKIIPAKIRKHLDCFSFISTFSMEGLIKEEKDRITNNSK